jgi:hypothetical protein
VQRAARPDATPLHLARATHTPAQIVANTRALEVSATWAGNSGRLVKNSTETFSHVTRIGAHDDVPHDHPNQSFAVWQLWAKPLRTDHTRWAALLVNVDVDARDLPLTFADISPALGEEPVATDVWSDRRVSVTRRTTVFRSVAAHDSIFLLLSKAS